MTPTDAAARWARTWRTAWEAGDPEPIVGLYHRDATFSSEPFRERYRGRSGVRTYVAGVFAEESAVRVQIGRPVVDGERAAIEWWASLVENGVETTLAGTSVLRFDPDGLVLEQRDTWNRADGRIAPPTSWGS